VSEPTRGIPGFKLVFTIIGVVYSAMGASMVVRGVGALRPFGVPDDVIASPVMGDFFTFFYELMTFIGALMILFGHVTVGRGRQTAVAAAFAVFDVLAGLRDLSTSDCRFGSRLYHGEATLVFVAIDVALALAFAALVVLGLRGGSTRRPVA
jgi:hypothetical protein